MDVCDSERCRASGHRQRKRARDRGAPFRARRRGVRRDREGRAADARSKRPRTIRSRCATCSRSSSKLKRSNRMETLHDAQQIKEEAQQMFDLGLLDLEARRRSRRSTGRSPQQIVDAASRAEIRAGGSEGARDSLGDQYICNFSVFQSLLDHWALGQLFPIMPIHRLNDSAGSATARWSTSPAIPTARSASSSICRT